MHYVFSTLTATTNYAMYAPNTSRDLPVIERSIIIKGGANLADKHFITPKGVMTEVSDTDLELLMKDYHFQQHMELGFITVERVKADAEVVAADMTSKDASAPMTPDDEKFKGEDAPKVAESSQGKKNKR